MAPASFQGATIGLVGCGRWGKFILRDLVSLGCRTWVVVRSAQGESNARAHGAHRIVTSLAMLPGELEGYVVAVPTAAHAAVIRELLDRQRPIFVEKPLTADPAAAEALVAAGGERLLVMDKWRHHPAIQTMAAWIQGGELGRPRTIKSRRIQWGSPHTDVDPVWILLPHELSIVLHLLGELPEPRWAVGERIAADHFVSLHAQLGSDPTALVEVSARSPHRQRELTVSCEGGAIMMSDPLADHLLLCRDDSDGPEQIPVSTEFPLLRELRAFLGFLRGGSAPDSSAQDGLRIVQSIARMRQMAAGSG